MARKACIIHKVSNLDPRSFFKQARSLGNAGYEVSIIGLFNRDRHVDGIKIIGAGEVRNRFGKFWKASLRTLLLAIGERADVYHFHDLDFVPWAVLLKLITGAQVIYDIHEAHPEYMLLKSYIPAVFRKPLYHLVYLTEHAASKLFDAIVPNDNFVAAGFNHKKNIVIFNFPSDEFFDEYKPLPFKEREFDLIYHGSLPKYHCETMMKIANTLNLDGISNLWAIMTSDTATQRWAQSELARRGLERNFTFLPYVSYTEVARYLGRAKIGIIPLPPYKKFMKNIPLKMFEFMGCAMPFVLSDLPPSRQFINGSNCAIKVEPDDIKGYADAIRFFLSSPEAAVKAGSAGAKLIRERYNWGIEEKKLLGLYESLLAGKK